MLYGIENEVRVGKCKIRKPSKNAENQYTLISTDDGRFFAFFKDGNSNYQLSEITKAVYQEMLQQARADEAYLRWKRRHMDDLVSENALTNKSADRNIRSMEDAAIATVLVGEESLVRSILTDSQWRRLYLRFCRGLTLKEIGILEGCTKMPIKRSIEDAMEKIKIFLR